MLWSSAAGYFMWHCHPSDPFGSSIIGSSLYLSSGYIQPHSRHVQHVTKPSQKQSSKNCRQVELQNHDNWKTVATESNESTCVQLHASDIKLVTIKTVDIKSKAVKWTSKELQVSNCFHWPPMTAPAKQWKLWQRFPTQLMQAKLDNQTTVPYTAHAASPGQLLLFLGRLTQWKTCTSNNKIQADVTTTDAVKFKWLANSCNPAFRTSKADLCTDAWKWDKTTP